MMMNDDDSDLHNDNDDVKPRTGRWGCHRCPGEPSIPAWDDHDYLMISGDFGDFDNCGDFDAVGDFDAYLIFVTGTTGAARVKNSVGCKFFQIERKQTTYFTFLG